MKSMILALLLTVSANVATAGIVHLSPISNELTINAYDTTIFLPDAMDIPFWGVIAAGQDPNATTVIPIGFNNFLGNDFLIPGEDIIVLPNDPMLGGGFTIQTAVGFGIIPTSKFEIVLYDQLNWHTPVRYAQVGPNSWEFIFEPDLLGPNPITALGGTQAGLILSDVGVTAVPVPEALWLFGSGLIGMVGIARRKDTNKA